MLYSTCVLKLISDVFVMRSSLKSQCISLDKSKTRYDCRSREQPTTAHKLVIWHTWCPKITKWVFFWFIGIFCLSFFLCVKNPRTFFMLKFLCYLPFHFWLLGMAYILSLFMLWVWIEWNESQCNQMTQLLNVKLDSNQECITEMWMLIAFTLSNFS